MLKVINTKNVYDLTYEDVLSICSSGDVLECEDGNIAMVVTVVDSVYNSILILTPQPRIITNNSCFTKFKKSNLNTIEFKYT